jgi:hypothetical protein
LSSVVQDDQGAVWLGTIRGADRIGRDGHIRTYTTRDGLRANTVACVQRDHTGAIWLGTANGVSVWRDGVIHSFSPADGLPDGPVLAVFETARGQLLVAVHGKGIFTLLGRLFIPLVTGFPGVVAISETPGGALLFSTLDGLYRWKDGDVDRINGTRGSYFAALGDASGTIWAVEATNGLVRIRGGVRTVFRGAARSFRAMICNVLDDDAGNFWITSDHALLRARKQDLEDFADGKSKDVFVSIYGAEDGMPGMQPQAGEQNTAWKGSDGRFWFVQAERGAVAFDPRAVTVKRTPPVTRVETLVVDGHDLGRPAWLPANSMRLEFHYTAVDFDAPELVTFRYRIVGFDKSWMDAGGRRVAEYMNLPHRRLTFEVQARNRQGVWDTAAATLAFELEPYFYQKWWFLVVCAVSLLSIGFAGHRLRLAQVRAGMERTMRLRLEERANIARDLHDTLLQGIAGISMQLRALARRLPDGGARSELRELINRMEQSARETRVALRELRLTGAARPRPRNSPRAIWPNAGSGLAAGLRNARGRPIISPSGGNSRQPDPNRPGSNPQRRETFRRPENHNHSVVWRDRCFAPSHRQRQRV